MMNLKAIKNEAVKQGPAIAVGLLFVTAKEVVSLVCRKLAQRKERKPEA
jgi:hypothetical protein